MNGSVAIGSRFSRDSAALVNTSISEFIIYNKTLTNTERQQIEGYLAWKWEFEANLPSDHPYRNEAPII
jgi:hypothetical protein